MRRFAFALLLLVPHLVEPSRAVEPSDMEKANLTFLVEGLIPQNGIVRAALFSSPDGFPGDTTKAYAINRSTVTVNSETMIFENIPFGSYAISVYQDLNKDQRLNKSIWGIPKEPVGFSNDPPLRRGPPHFEDAVFSFNEPLKRITVHMRTR